VHLKKRGLGEAGRKIVETRDSTRRLHIEKGLIGGAPVRGGKKPVILKDTRQAPKDSATAAPFKPAPGRKYNDMIRREDYADIYQLGRRVSSTQKLSTRVRTASGTGATGAHSPRESGRPFGRLPQSQQSGTFPTGTAAAVQTTLRAVPQKKKFHARRFISIAATAALLTAAVLGVFSIVQPQHALADGEEVFFDGRMLGIVENKDDAQKALQQIDSDLQKTYGMPIQQGSQLSFSPVLCESQNIMGGSDIAAVLKNNVAVKVVASVITVDGHPAVALHSADEAQQVLNTVLSPFMNAPASLYRTDVGFVEDVKVTQMPVDYGLLQGVDDAVHTLTLGTSVQDNPYTVKKGDTLAKIAKKFKITMADIFKANPEIASSDVIQPGQTLNAVKPQNWVSVRYTQQVQRQEKLPFDTVKQQDDSLYTTQSKVQQEGKNGERDVWAKVTYINGVEAQENVISQTVVSPAQNEILLQGTKKVPTNSGGGSTTAISSGKFIVPLKYAYRISGTFGPRNLAGAASNFHYGVDMAAPKGTPIYASRAGTVVYSGSATGYGLVVYINHGDGLQTRYGHCSKLLVKSGQAVSQGQLIALVGATGDATGPHLHFEIRVNGVAVNPMKYVKL